MAKLPKRRAISRDLKLSDDMLETINWTLQALVADRTAESIDFNDYG